MTDFPKTDINTVHRSAPRATYDKETIYAIVDAARICHIGFIDNDRPIIIPTIHARRDDTILLHGSKVSRLMQHIAAGNEICITTTHVDALILARSAFHHSMNYRSAILFGTGHAIEDETQKRDALDHIVDTVIPGRAQDARKADPKELNATLVVAIQIESASAKIRTGGPNDAQEDLDLPIWAGTLPLQEQILEPIPDPNGRQENPLPDYINNVGP